MLFQAWRGAGPTAAVHDLIMATANHMHARAERHYYAGFADDLDLFLDFGFELPCLAMGGVR